MFLFGLQKVCALLPSSMCWFHSKLHVSTFDTQYPSLSGVEVVLKSCSQYRPSAAEGGCLQWQSCTAAGAKSTGRQRR